MNDLAGKAPIQVARQGHDVLETLTYHVNGEIFNFNGPKVGVVITVHHCANPFLLIEILSDKEHRREHYGDLQGIENA